MDLYLELTRYKRRVPELDMETLQFITSNYLINHSDVQASLLVCIAGPVVYAIKDEVEAYLTLERVMRTFGIFQYSWIEDYFVQYSISHRVSQFMSLFRRKIPDLFSYFEDEEVKANDWAANWLQSFLSKELPLPIVVGIWDLYFSEGLDLHYYICLSILKLCKESLEELEQSEIISYLAKLPHFDPDELINSALNMKDDDLE